MRHTKLFMTVPDVADRYTIAILKATHLSGARDDEVTELLRYEDALLPWLGAPCFDAVLAALFTVNWKLWKTEGGIRDGSLTDLAEVGRRALQVRTLNRVRCTLKNHLVDMTQSGHKEVKVNYAGSGECKPYTLLCERLAEFPAGVWRPVGDRATALRRVAVSLDEKMEWLAPQAWELVWSVIAGEVHGGV